MDENTVRLNGTEAIPFIYKDGRVLLVPKSQLEFFLDELHFLLADVWEGGEEEDDSNL